MQGIQKNSRQNPGLHSPSTMKRTSQRSTHSHKRVNQEESTDTRSQLLPVP
ncbi:hypothetical protein P9112_013052 [Eukaryota sp. TZLM1-RC]